MQIRQVAARLGDKDVYEVSDADPGVLNNLRCFCRLRRRGGGACQAEPKVGTGGFRQLLSPLRYGRRCDEINLVGQSGEVRP